MANPTTPTEWEKKSYSYFLSVMNKNQEIRHCFMDARMALESLAMNLYKERAKRDAPDLLSSIDGLNQLKAFPNEGLFHTMHFIRKIGNGQVHPGDEYNVELLNTIRLGLLSIFKWHFVQTRGYRSYTKDFSDFAAKTANIKENPLLYMFRNEGFSEAVMNQKVSKKKKEAKGVKLETTRMPIFGVFVIDMSGSMRPYRDDVIFAHGLAIESLRASAACIQKRLYLTQYVFNDTINPPINQLEILRNDEGDRIVLLNEANYNPNGGTALYDTLESILDNIYDEIAAIRKNESKKAQLSIAVITDGMDEHSKTATAGTIKNLMQNLLENKFHYSSVVIGLTDPAAFSPKKLEEIRNSLGFSEVISIDFSDKNIESKRKKIREAFKLGSQKIAGQ